MAVLGLRFCARAFSSCGKRGPLFIAVRGPLTIMASLVVEHRLQTRRLSNCGSRAQLLHGMWDLPRPGLEPVSSREILKLPTPRPFPRPMKSESLRGSSIGILSTIRSYHWAVSVALLLPVSSLLPGWPYPLTAKFSTVLENTALGEATRDSPGGPEVKTLCFQFRGRRFNPWSGSKITRATLHGQNKKKTRKKKK